MDLNSIRKLRYSSDSSYLDELYSSKLEYNAVVAMLSNEKLSFKTFAQILKDDNEDLLKIAAKSILMSKEKFATLVFSKSESIKDTITVFSLGDGPFPYPKTHEYNPVISILSKNHNLHKSVYPKILDYILNELQEFVESDIFYEGYIYHELNYWNLYANPNIFGTDIELTLIRALVDSHQIKDGISMMRDYPSNVLHEVFMEHLLSCENNECNLKKTHILEEISDKIESLENKELIEKAYEMFTKIAGIQTRFSLKMLNNVKPESEKVKLAKEYSVLTLSDFEIRAKPLDSLLSMQLVEDASMSEFNELKNNSIEKVIEDFSDYEEEYGKFVSYHEFNSIKKFYIVKPDGNLYEREASGVVFCDGAIGILITCPCENHIAYDDKATMWIAFDLLVEASLSSARTSDDGEDLFLFGVKFKSNFHIYPLGMFNNLLLGLKELQTRRTWL